MFAAFVALRRCPSLQVPFTKQWPLYPLGTAASSIEDRGSCPLPSFIITPIRRPTDINKRIPIILFL